MKRPNDYELASYGYDHSARLGHLANYMRMMNRGKIGGYTTAQISKAEAQDASRAVK